MRLIVTGLVLLAMISFSPVLGKTESCLDSFGDFKTIEVKANPAHPFDDYDSVISMAWYRECILVGSTNGLWLYDIQRPENPILLAHLSDRAVSYIAVNPHDIMIAFNLFHESTVYFISPDQMVSTLNAQNQAINDISFSPDGSLMGVASAKITDSETEYGLNYDSIIQILDASRNVVMSIPSDLDSSAPITIVIKVIFSDDSKHLFTYNLRPGYDSDKVTYWDVGTGKKVWNYDDLFRNLKWIPDTDPLFITDASMSNRIAALGGKDGVQDWDDYYGTAVHLWDVDTQQRLGYVVISRRGSDNDEEHLTDLTLNHDGSILITGQNNGVIRFWNTKNASEHPNPIKLSSPISQLLYDSSEKYLAIRSGTRVVIWDTNEGKKVSSFSLVKDS